MDQLTSLSKEENFLTAWILCRDRPYYLNLLLESIDRQILPPVKLIISDNSMNEEVKILSKEYKEIAYRRRLPNLSPVEHLRCIADETYSKYVIALHDDDLLLPNFFSNFYRIYSEYNNFSAYASNAIKISGAGKPIGICSIDRRKLLSIDSPRKLAWQYFSFLSTGISPYPGYFYKTALFKKNLKKLIESTNSDYEFLMDFTEEGSGLLWSNIPTMLYREHSQSHSAKVSIKGSNKIRRYTMRKIGLTKNTSMIKEFRLRYLIIYLMQKIAKNNSFEILVKNRSRIILKYCFSNYRIFIKPKYILFIGLKMAIKRMLILHYSFKLHSSRKDVKRV